MISTKTMIKDEFTKANSLEYEDDCDMDVENDDGDYFENFEYFTWLSLLCNAFVEKDKEAFAVVKSFRKFRNILFRKFRPLRR